MSLRAFHPIVQQWFQARFGVPTEPQERGWPLIQNGSDLLIAAPTGSGKTLTAFLAAIDQLFRQAVNGELSDEIQVVYVSPLRALSGDMQRNLEIPLHEIQELAFQSGLSVPPIRTALRTGDTRASARSAILRRPPHILITTPESLYLMLTSSRARETLRSTRTVIVDEIHALVRDKRGSHLSLTLARLDALCPRQIQKIGLSATQRPMDEIARFLTSVSNPAILDIGHQRQLKLQIEIPSSELGAVCMHEQWAEVNARIAELVTSHRSTMIFVNTRRLAERLTHQLSELLGEDAVCSHHGSLAYSHRHQTEQRLKSGELRAVVATASLEMGIDVGSIDLVIQIGSPRSISGFLQRIGRSGHALGLIPEGRLFALTRDELIECMALMRGIRHGNLDRVQIPQAPLDVLAQQIVAEVACREWPTDELYECFRSAGPYRNLKRGDFDSIASLLSEGMSVNQGRSRVLLHHDQVRRILKPRPGARLAAIANAGAIPDLFAIRVLADDDETVVGSVDEEFATESQSGDVFLLGNNSWQIRYLRGGDLYVRDAHGAAPTVPFWRGEAPGRTRELSDEVSRLREDIEPLLDTPDIAAEWLASETYSPAAAVNQAVEYLRAQKAAIGLLPTMKRVVFERFFDESGGMQLVIHAPFGTRITRAWGLAMRKRFCRSFDFELQASADDDGIVLSLGPQHSFPIESLFSMLTSDNVQPMFEQAVLVVPIFTNRWRWNATRALLVSRARNGRRVPPAIQRFRSEDLLTAIFPKLTGCQENVVGDIELPDHPLINQTMEDCLSEAHDMAALQKILSDREDGQITFLARDTREPSPFSYELLNANPYAFLDGGEVAERRARAVSTRRTLTVDSVEDLGRLDEDAIRDVILESQPLVRSVDELHDVLLSRILLPESEAFEGTTSVDADLWLKWFRELQKDGRALVATIATASDIRQLSDGGDPGVPGSEGTTVRRYWVATERRPAVLAAFPDAECCPDVVVPSEVRHDWEMTEVRVALVRGLLEICGPITSASAAAQIGLTQAQTDAALEALEGEGVVLRGRFTPQSPESDGDSSTEWCHRRILARIHRRTMEGLRKQIQPVTAESYQQFLFHHHGMLSENRRSGTNGLYEVIGQLQGIEIPAISWERDILPLRLADYRTDWLDELCLSGDISWSRLFPAPRKADAGKNDRGRPMMSLTRVAPVAIHLREDSPWLTAGIPARDDVGISSPAMHVVEILTAKGAMFTSDLLTATGMLRDHLDDALGELVSRGRLTSDGFAGLRLLIRERVQSSRRENHRRAGIRRTAGLATSGVAAGRWSLVNSADDPRGHSPESAVEWAWQLLRRWGVVFRDLLQMEAGTPSWFELLQVYRRLEARGEIRGGRFVTGVAGEQFASAESVQRLRQTRDTVAGDDILIISAADPVNLVGIITQQDRVPRTASNRVAFSGGRALCCLQGGEIRILIQSDDPAIQELLEKAISRLRSSELCGSDESGCLHAESAACSAGTLPGTTSEDST
ncbi:MAG: DEAD/DEAH box helicase [Planctomyces sp.]